MSGRFTFRRRHRLTRALEYKAVFDGRVRKTHGALTVFTRPNDLPHPRLGLSVGRRVGGAVVRNRAKRLVREAFRHLQHEFPVTESGSYDIVVCVRPSFRVEAGEVQSSLAQLVGACDRQWARRSRREGAADG